MALIFADSFDHYNSASLFDSKWLYHNVTGNTMTTTTGRYGYGQALRLQNLLQAWGNKFFETNYPTIIMGAAYRIANVQGGSTLQGGATFPGISIMHFTQGGSANANIQNGVGINGLGQLVCFAGVWTTILGSSAPNAIRNNTWNYIECRMTTHNSAGAFEVRLNGVTIYSGSGVNTRTTSSNFVDGINLGCVTLGNVDVDDVYVCDTSGSRNNDFLGEIDVRTQFPNSDNSVQFTHNTGASNFAAVADNPPNDATSYAESSTVGQKDFYGMPAMGGVTPSAIKAVVVTSRLAKSESGLRTGRVNLKSGSTTGNGATVNPSSSYNFQQDIFETDPNGSIAWTAANVNAALPGLEVVS